MFMERNSATGAAIEYPIGGSRGVVDALVRGIERAGGRVLLRAPVAALLVEGGRCAGAALAPRPGAPPGAPPELVRARRAVVSNASTWDTAALLAASGASAAAAAVRGAGAGAKLDAYVADTSATPMCGSFMHLHLGIDAAGLPPDLDAHHLVVNDWSALEAPQNVCIASIATQFDASLAPPGKAAVHAYTAGNEPWAPWAAVERGSAAYNALKEERAAPLWAALERAIPDVRARAELTLVGTPLTHARFLRRAAGKGSYGPAISAATGAFPGPATPLPGLYRCGDGCAPGIGVPAAAASGIITANTLAPVWSHLRLLGEMDALA
jgi:phytoene dehydrogenase-like protein